MKSLRKGATAVEAAFIIPVVFLFVFGGVEVVRVNVVRHTARNAAYEATRTAIVPGASAQDAIDAANEILAICGIRGATVTIEPTTIVEDTQFVTTRIEVPMSSNSWGVGIFARNATLNYATTLRTERSPLVQASAIEETTQAFEESQTDDPANDTTWDNGGDEPADGSSDNASDTDGDSDNDDDSATTNPPDASGSGDGNEPDQNQTPDPEPEPNPPQDNPNPKSPGNSGNGSNPSPPKPKPILL